MQFQRRSKLLIFGFTMQIAIASLLWWGGSLRLKQQAIAFELEAQTGEVAGPNLSATTGNSTRIQEQVRQLSNVSQLNLIILGSFLFLSTALLHGIAVCRFQWLTPRKSLEVEPDEALSSLGTGAIQGKLKARDALIKGLANFVESRGKEAGHHINRIANYVLLLCEELRAHNEMLDDDLIEDLVLASTLHDIGMIRIPESILLKPGELSRKEREAVQQHARLGGECISAVQEEVRRDNLLELANQIVSHHHERWDGMGYPDGLSGNAIPLAARIVTLADVYDALTTERPYKRAMSHSHAMEIIKDQAERQFDPQVVDAFVACEQEFLEVKRNWGIDEPDGPQDEAALLEKLLNVCASEEASELEAEQSLT